MNDENIAYSEEYDAYYYVDTGEWIDPRCGDMDCPFCNGRPENMKEVVAQQEQDEKFCDANCVWTDHHPDCKLAQPEQKKCENCGEFGECCQAQPSGSVEQEPVAWRKLIDGEYGFCDDMTDFPTHEDFGWEPLYTTPPQRTWVGLTNEEVASIYMNHTDRPMYEQWNFARAIEAKLKEKNT